MKSSAVQQTPPTSHKNETYDPPRLAFSLFAIPHLLEQLDYLRENDEEDTSTGAQTQDLGQETAVQGAEAFLLGDGRERRVGPVVLGGNAGHPGSVLDATER